MNIKKPIPMIASSNVHTVCPVCGTRTYSQSGIHPQCAVHQADAPRVKKYKAEKKQLPKKKAKEGRTGYSWKKTCPRCGVELHVRIKTCDCGFRFAP